MTDLASTPKIGSDVNYVIEGGHRLEGTVFIQGAKNAALPMIAAALMAETGQTVLRNVPLIGDVLVAVELARAVGAKVEIHEAERSLVIDASNLTSSVLPAHLTSLIRGSVLFIPPVLHRMGEVLLEGVGGCDLGGRGLDFHYRGFARLGASVTEEGESIRVKASRLKGAGMYLDMPSHTGTENLIAAAAGAIGVSTIENPALEPEIGAVAEFLNKMGARITGCGTGCITVEGVEKLVAVEHTVMSDRLDAGVFAMAVAATGGDATLVGTEFSHFGVVHHKLEQMGVEMVADGAVVRVRCVRPHLRPINVVTWPFPGFATDLQPPILALACGAHGTSYIRDTIFEKRFALAEELSKMGADVQAADGVAVVHGPAKLHGARVFAHDLRAGSSLVIAGLMADGQTIIKNGRMIDRGHAQFDERLRSLGAVVTRNS